MLIDDFDRRPEKDVKRFYMPRLLLNRILVLFLNQLKLYLQNFKK